MMVTEEEARKKWCPFSLTAGENGASVNRVAGQYDRHGIESVFVYGRHRCISAECMAWRANISSNLGYCGLAGKP